MADLSALASASFDLIFHPVANVFAAGFSVVGFYEDHWPDGSSPLNRYCPVAVATRSVKPGVE
jgi:hypothetical protein